MNRFRSICYLVVVSSITRIPGASTMWGQVIAKMSIRLFAIAFSLPLVVAAHTPLLPRPQRVAYKADSVRVSSLRIELSLAASSEDRFAAAELARKLLQRTSID